MYQETYRAVEEALKDATGAEDVLLGDGGDHADLASTIAFAYPDSHSYDGDHSDSHTDIVGQCDAFVASRGPDRRRFQRAIG